MGWNWKGLMWGQGVKGSRDSTTQLKGMSRGLRGHCTLAELFCDCHRTHLPVIALTARSKARWMKERTNERTKQCFSKNTHSFCISFVHSFIGITNADEGGRRCADARVLLCFLLIFCIYCKPAFCDQSVPLVRWKLYRGKWSKSNLHDPTHLVGSGWANCGMGTFFGHASVQLTGNRELLIFIPLCAGWLRIFFTSLF